MTHELIAIENCAVFDGIKVRLPRVDWKMLTGESWLITGANGSGKAEFKDALCHRFSFKENGADSRFYSEFGTSVAVVSLEEAARLIEEERKRDMSEILNREDEGRTVRRYIAETMPKGDDRLEAFPEVKLCGIEHILDRGLRYLSTGEMRRTLLCRALLSGKKLIILSEPFAGLDKESRALMLSFFDSMFHRQCAAYEKNAPLARIILFSERFTDIPASVSHVLEFSQNVISFCGTYSDYEKKRSTQNAQIQSNHKAELQAFSEALERIQKDAGFKKKVFSCASSDSLIRFEKVNVGWGDHAVLVDMDWEVKAGEHWLIRGPNGSGKTTLLELITGDNMQVFREKVYLFGKRRGSGETIWDIKKRLGIVSYRLHVEYRMVGSTSVRDTVLSGFYDSIGLYERPGDYEIAIAREWLKLAGFATRENEPFSSLSYGEQRAVLILRAAVKSPDVLILDEPCHALDERYRFILLGLLETIARTGTTTLLHVAHEADEVLDAEKHILELNPCSTPMYSILNRA